MSQEDERTQQEEEGNKTTQPDDNTQQFVPTPELIKQVDNIYLYAFDAGQLDALQYTSGLFPMSMWMRRVYDQIIRRYIDKYGIGLEKNQVCPEWGLNCSAFYEWCTATGYDPANNVTLRRKDPNKAFSPDNCYWVERAGNPLGTHQYMVAAMVTYKGVSLSVAEWAKLLCVGSIWLLERLKLVDFNLRKALSKRYGCTYDYDSDVRSLDEAVDEYYREIELRKYKKAQYWMQLQDYGIPDTPRIFTSVVASRMAIDERIKKMVSEFDMYD